ncbi:MAG TPA: RsmB/NOP family class I SAM-dependent RNA methyltransferase [Roseovarius sp.]|nr:RsmB/NOP family class I SAM-dependent RNA methyltransferase [Roseovarius sp.]
MTPAARVQAAIELLDDIATGTPAERALTGWARRSRFAGSKDRAAVRDHVFQALRCWRSYACLGGAATGRGLMLGALRDQGLDPTEVFTGQGHAPKPLSEDEAKAGAAPVSEVDRLDLPEWQVPLFRDALGPEADAAAMALRQRAPVVLRVNMRLNTVPQAIEKLKECGVLAEPVAGVGTALHVIDGARRVAQSQAYQSGLVELQDGSSQAAMNALDLPSGAKVLDYCAGGGGKVLALAARIEGHWFAHDADPARMADLAPRATRAGVRVVQVLGDQVAAHGPYDLVLCDAPCSGSGTWRRAPDAKWRLTPERLAELCDIQAGILDQAQALVAPGGRLAYATCSLFRAENEAQSDSFVARHDGWHETDRRRWPVSAVGDGFYLSVFAR